MSPFRAVIPGFAVAAQLAESDVARAAQEGYRLIVNNRPEGESPGQVAGDVIAAAARAAGLRYLALPISGPPTAQTVDAMAELLRNEPGAVLAYCRSGTRSLTAWALAQASMGQRGADELIALAARAGYDLGGARAALERFCAKPAGPG